jgi:hypothetical protein
MGTTRDARRRATLLQLVSDSEQERSAAHEIYADDAVLEFPQSGERFVGKRNFQEWRQKYPGDVQFEVRRLHGGGALWVLEVLARYDGGEPQYGVSIHEFRGDLLVHETIYVAPGWAAPEWRARWREDSADGA